MKQLTAFAAIGLMSVVFSNVAQPPLARAESEDAPQSHKAEFPREWTWARGPSQAESLKKLIGKPAPALTVGPWLGEAPPSLAELKGKIVLIDFWATWCGPCLKAVPHTNEVMTKYKDRGVVVIGVCGTSTPGGTPMAKSAKKTGMKFPTAEDQANTTAGAWGVQWWPFYVIIDREGIVRVAGLRSEKIDAALDEMLKEQPG